MWDRSAGILISPRLSIATHSNLYLDIIVIEMATLGRFLALRRTHEWVDVPDRVRQRVGELSQKRAALCARYG